MTYALLTPTQATILRHARTLSGDERKAIKREVFDMSRSRFGIPAGDRLKAEIDDTTVPHYMHVRNADTSLSYMLNPATGRFSGNGTTEPTRVYRTFLVSADDICGYLQDSIADGDRDLTDGDEATADTPLIEVLGSNFSVRLDVTYTR